MQEPDRIIMLSMGNLAQGRVTREITATTGSTIARIWAVQGFRGVLSF